MAKAVTMADMIGKDKKRLVITLSLPEIKRVQKVKERHFPCVPLATVVRLIILKGLDTAEAEG